MTRPAVSGLDRLIVRLVHAQSQSSFGRIASAVLRLLGVHIPAQVQVGPGLLLPHSTTGLVVHAATSIGSDVTLFHGVTIGRRDAYDLRPGPFLGAVIEDGAVLCAGAVVLPDGVTPLVVAKGSVVGANAVLTSSTRPHEVWAGNPAKRVSAPSHPSDA